MDGNDWKCYDETKIRDGYSRLTKCLIEQKLTITTMESATSGLIASLLTDTEGSSQIFPGAFVTYCNEAKIQQGVPKEIIDTFSVYSRETAMAMAEAARNAYHTDLAIGVTGTMGNIDPANADASVPGCVYFAVLFHDEMQAYEVRIPFQQNRNRYKLAAAKEISDVLMKMLSEKCRQEGAVVNDIDLHLHSRYSDGSDDAPELLKKLKACGIRTFALTDHDTIDGCRAVKELVPDDMQFIPGIEFSCQTSYKKCHILGYGINTDAEELLRVIEEGHKLRQAKFCRRIEYLKTVYGITFTEEEMEELQSLTAVGKPHLAKLLIQRGLADSIADAMKNYLKFPGKTDDRIDAARAIAAIRAAGGIPVWAHPLGGEGARHLSEPEFRTQFEILREAGIQGLECCYSRYNKEEIAFLTRVAKAEKLCISGGSDYHGTNKNVQPGTLNCEGESVARERLTVLEKLPKKKY